MFSFIHEDEKTFLAVIGKIQRALACVEPITVPGLLSMVSAKLAEQRLKACSLESEGPGSNPDVALQHSDLG